MRTYAKEYFYNNIAEYMKLLLIVIIGIIIAIITINNTDAVGREEIREITNKRIASVKTSQNVNKNLIFTRSIQRNTKELLIVIFLSTTIIGLPIAYFLIIKKAFSIGYTISAIFATQSTKTSIIFICNGLLFHNIIYMISMFIILVAGGNLIKNLMKEEKSIKLEIIRYIVFVTIAMLIVIIASLMEAYFSTFFLSAFKKYL